MLDGSSEMSRTDMQAHSVQFMKLVLEHNKYVAQGNPVRSRRAMLFQYLIPLWLHGTANP